MLAELMPAQSAPVNVNGDVTFHDTEPSCSSIRLVKIEQDVSMILENQLQLVECASRMDRALSLVVKCLPVMLRGTEQTVDLDDPSPQLDQRGPIMGDNVPQMLQRGRHNGSMSRERQKQMVDASDCALSRLLSQEIQKLQMEMMGWFEKGASLKEPRIYEANARLQPCHSLSSGDRAESQSRRISPKGDIDFDGLDTTKWAQMELDGLSAVRDNRIDKVIKLLDKRLDPNTEFRDVKFGHQTLRYCNFLAAAIHAASSSMVELLVNRLANVDAVYGFTTGSSRIAWSGPVSFIAVANGDLEKLGMLLKLLADPHAVSSLNANMVWQAAYSGHANVLKYLLNLDVDIEKKAWSPNKEGVSYSPLHIAINAGKNLCVKTLLNAKAKTNYVNQEGFSPLEDAIRNHRPGMVNSLVSAGANLVGQFDADFRTTRSAASLISEQTHSTDVSKSFYAKFSCVMFYKYSSATLQALFEAQNPILVRAAAIGLQGQADQVALMSLEDVTGFFEVPGAPKIEILRALFCVRKVQYRGPNQEVLNLKLAALGHEYGFPHVLLSEHSFHEMEAAFKAGQEFDPSVKAFLGKLVPQQVPPTRMAMPSKVFVLVRIYECLLPGLETDLRIMRALSECHRFDKIWEELACQAIFKFGWKQTQWMALVETVVQAMLMAVFWILAFLSMEKSGQARFLGLSHHGSIQCAAFLGLPFWLCEVCKELFQLFAYISEGWLMKYTTSLANHFDIARIFLDGLLLLQFCAGDDDAYDKYEFRICFAACCFLKWTKSVYTLSSFRGFGFQVLPILFTFQDIGPFVVIMLFYLAGISHAFCATDFLKEQASVTILNSFYFGMLADESRIRRVYYVNEEDVELSNQQWITSALVLLIGFALPITLMNIFIAALSTSYEHGAKSKESLFQHRRATSVLSQTAIQRLLLRIRCTQRSTNKPLRLWYCGCKEVGDS